VAFAFWSYGCENPQGRTPILRSKWCTACAKALLPETRSVSTSKPVIRTSPTRCFLLLELRVREPAWKNADFAKQMAHGVRQGVAS